MRPRGAAVAEGIAAAMGGAAADRVGKFERQSLRRVVPDGRADAADGRVCESEAVGALHLVRSNEQISSDLRQFLMPRAVAFFAPHHMMTVILHSWHLTESHPWPNPPIPSSSSPPSGHRSAASWASFRRWPRTSSDRT